jgi:hypothetical protein
MSYVEHTFPCCCSSFLLFIKCQSCKPPSIHKFKSIPHTWHNTKENSITNYSHHFVSYQKSQSTHKIYNTKSSLTFPTQQQSQTPTSHPKKKKKKREKKQNKTNKQTKWGNTKPCLASSSATCKLTRLMGDTNPKKENNLISHFIWTSWVWTSEVAGCEAAPRQAVSTKRKDLNQYRDHRRTSEAS